VLVGGDFGDGGAGGGLVDDGAGAARNRPGGPVRGRPGAAAAGVGRPGAAAVHVAALVRVFLAAGWSVSDLAYALDHAPDGAAHWHTAPVHSPAAATPAQRREHLAAIRATLAERRRPA